MLFIIKHCTPLQDPARLPHEWRLSEAGCASAEILAKKLQSIAPDISRVVSSEERKAVETAEIIAAKFNLHASTDPDLREHDRGNESVMRSRNYISAMAQFFSEPDELTLGRETARSAEGRITNAVDDIVAANPNETLAIVTHGTVIALLLAPLLHEEPFKIWRRMSYPAFVQIEWNARQVVQVVDQINAE